MTRSRPNVIQRSFFSLFTATYTHAHKQPNRSYPPTCYPFSFAEFIPCAVAPWSLALNLYVDSQLMQPCCFFLSMTGSLQVYYLGLTYLSLGQ